jgi:TRAP-type C4-dicarboxylate transport system permease small subunit
MNEHGRPEGEAALPASGLVRFADSFEALLGKIYTPIAWVGAATLAALVVAMFYSVVARRFFNSPLEGSGDIIEMSLLIMTATVLGLEHLGHEKMTVDLLISRFSKKAQAIIAPVIYCLAIAILCVAFYELLVYAAKLLERGETTPGVLELPKYPFAYLIAFGILTLIPIYVVRLLRSLGELRTP